MKVLCLWYATEDEIYAIKKAMPIGTEVVAPHGDYFSRFDCSYSDLQRHAIDADAFIGFAIPEGLLEVANNLKLLCWLHSGCNDIDLALLRKRGVKVANARGANADAIAEQAMMFMLALAKKTFAKHQAAVEGRATFPLWDSEHRLAMLDGRTLGLIGVGNIGSRVARYAKAFNMQVLGVRRHKERPAEGVDSMHGTDELPAVLAKSDYVVLAAPITKETRHFIGKAELARMKPSAFLINVARGHLIEERALYESLTSGRLRGYAADVWWSYESMPLKRSFPGGMTRLNVHKLPNVICSLGEAHNSDDVLERLIQCGISSLVEFAAEKPITRQIDLELGY